MQWLPVSNETARHLCQLGCPSRQPGRVAKGDEPFSTLIPEIQGDASQALPNRQGVGQLKFLDRAVAALEIVVWNPGPQVMDVVQSDVARKPLKNLGKFIV